MLTGLAPACRAQTAVLPAAPAAAHSTLAGVFDAEQAAQGKDVYLGLCRSCHTPAAHAVTFTARWAGRRLSEPFQYITENMPKDNAGILSPEQTATVLAYFLNLMGMPSGNDTLPADSVALDMILIDTLATDPKHSSGR